MSSDQHIRTCMKLVCSTWLNHCQLGNGCNGAGALHYDLGEGPGIRTRFKTTLLIINLRGLGHLYILYGSTWVIFYLYSTVGCFVMASKVLAA